MYDDAAPRYFKSKCLLAKSLAWMHTGEAGARRTQMALTTAMDRQVSNPRLLSVSLLLQQSVSRFLECEGLGVYKLSCPPLNDHRVFASSINPPLPPSADFLAKLARVFCHNLTSVHTHTTRISLCSCRRNSVCFLSLRLLVGLLHPRIFSHHLGLGCTPPPPPSPNNC